MRQVGDVAVLEREVYGMAEAARLLGLRPITLRRWVDGYLKYPPVIRLEPSGSDIVTWGEFVEAGYLAEYRRRHNIPLQRLRPAILALRKTFKVPYPLAHAAPFLDVGQRELLLRLQEEAGLGRRLAPLVVLRNDQFVLADPAESFLEKVDFGSDKTGAVERLYPLDKNQPVVIDPLRSFGAPSVRGIRTENLFELFQAGESLEAIAEVFDLEPHDVEAAVRFESAPRAAA
jgi:uncharacterized protein (DUF433 family)